jgi:hypothetical protein
MQRYLLKRLKKNLCESEISKLVREQHLFGLNENNVAMNLRPLTASVWLIYRRNEGQEKNIFAHAKLVALQGTLYAVFNDTPKRTTL